VTEVVSDTELKLKAPGVNYHNADQDYKYKIIPKLDQSNVYDAVEDRLIRG
jgi:hypothetical protein